MIALSPLAGRSVGVFGLGKAGAASVTALAAGGADVYAWDDRPVSGSDARYIPVQQWPWEKLVAVVLAPGVPLTHPVPHPVVTLAERHKVPVVGDVELLYRAQPDAHYVAITGTNGKSTTTTLIGHIFHSAGRTAEVGGNLGTAALSLEPMGKGEDYILELSSYQLDLLHTARFNVAVLLNITPDHLDRHGDMQGYITAKKHIFERQQMEDAAVIVVDDEYTKAIAGELKVVGMQRVVPVSTQHAVDGGVFVKDGVLVDRLDDMGREFDLRDIESLPGAHNWQNAACAYAAARLSGIEPEVIYAALKSFAGLRHRLQAVATINDVKFINDSKATNADAVQHALKPYNNIYWIAGGKAKSGGIEALAPLFPHVKRAYLIGDAQDMFAKTLEGTLDYVCCGTLEQATEQAARDAFSEAMEGAVVLLSPACASFDQFKSFEHRGDVFIACVEKIANAS